MLAIRGESENFIAVIARPSRNGDDCDCCRAVCLDNGKSSTEHSWKNQRETIVKKFNLNNIYLVRTAQ